MTQIKDANEKLITPLLIKLKNTYDICQNEIDIFLFVLQLPPSHGEGRKQPSWRPQSLMNFPVFFYMPLMFLELDNEDVRTPEMLI